jgi:hypothetical protein
MNLTQCTKFKQINPMIEEKSERIYFLSEFWQKKREMLVKLANLFAQEFSRW